MLERRLSLLQAVSLNMAMMVGIGPFITIPLLVASLGGPQSMIGWVLGAIVALADGLVWSELAAAFPGSGGTYHFYDAVYGNSRAGRVLTFLFVWQFLFSAPLELASGGLGLARYLSFFWTGLKHPVWQLGSVGGGFGWEVTWGQFLAIGIMAALVLLAYRKVEEAGKLMVVLWAGMLLTVGWIIVAGAVQFDASRALDFPPNAWRLSKSFALGLGSGLAIAMYDYLGYYQICYMGDEVIDPARTIPRSILISVAVISAVYFFMTLAILGVVPWREVIDSGHIVSDFMLRLHGRWPARVVTLFIVWTAAAGTFAALLSYSRVPYAAARAGRFFRGLAHTHPTGHFPHRSLLLVGGVATLACLADLESVISALLTSRILIQFVGQIATVAYLRTRPELYTRMPFRMWFFPVPAIIALVGWLFVLGTSPERTLVYGLLSFNLGLEAFLLWDRETQAEK
jgi:amino acid transporter